MLIGVEGHAHGAVAAGMEPDLEALLVVEGHRAAQVLGAPVRKPGASRGIGLEHGGRPGVDHAVHHALQGAEAEVRVARVLVPKPPIPGQEVVGRILDHAEGAPHAHLEAALREEPLEHGQVALVEPGVLDRGQAVGGRERHSLHEGAILLVCARRWNHSLHQGARGFLEQPRGLALRVLDDDPVRRVLRRTRDPGQGQRLRVGPGRVTVAVAQEHGPVRDRRVEGPAMGRAAELTIRPASAHDPRPIGMGLGIGGEAILHLVSVARTHEVELLQRQAPHHRVEVGVAEPRGHEPAGEIDDLRPRPAQGLYGGRGAHGQEGLAAHRESLGPGVRRVPRPDVGIDEDAVGLPGGRGLRAQGACARREGERAQGDPTPQSPRTPGHGRCPARP